MHLSLIVVVAAGDLLNKYLYLTGKVNMRAIETTIQNLIGCGMNPKTENNPYLGFVYTSFQERATKVSHGHTAHQAGEYGEKARSRACGCMVEFGPVRLPFPRLMSASEHSKEEGFD